MKLQITPVFLCAAVSLFMPFARAQSLNGGFETGGFTAWATIGQPTVQSASFGYAPLAGSFSALVSNNGAAVSVGELEGFANLDPGTLDGIRPPGSLAVTQGAAIRQTFQAQAGDILSFRYVFFTNQGIDTQFFNDFSFVVLQGPGQGYAEQIAQVPDTLIDIPDTNNPAFARASGERTYSRFLSQSGTYALTLGVVDVGDDVVDSGLFVDSVMVAAAPEAGTLLFLVIGAIGLCLRRKTG